MKEPPIAILVPSPAGLATARLIAAALPGAELHGRAGRLHEADVFFAETMSHLRRLFAEGHAIIGVCAAGILIRALAPLLDDKRQEAPVLAVSGDGASIVPLLGGHRGGNALARRLSEALSGHAAITTAGDVALGVALDDPPPGWRLANPEATGPIAASLLAGEKAHLVVEAGTAEWLAPLATAPSPAYYGDGALNSRIKRTVTVIGTPTILVTDRVRDPAPRTLVYHPPVLALGVGCERDTAPEELDGLVKETLAAHGLAAGAVACVASLDLKMDEPAVQGLAAALGVPARFFTPGRLEAETPRLLNPSDLVFRATGCHGVAEGAALAASGAQGELVVAKRRSVRATCAIARAPRAIDPGQVGQARGQLAMVGVGPGQRSWRSPEASRVLMEADDIVGYGGYFALIDNLTLPGQRHEFALGEEEARVRSALALAGAGKRVALIGSGDAGIYGMASLVLELIEREDRPEWNRIALSFIPGISALQAAAARAGAPLGHDFCAISLSDLLTPWAVIERRLRAACDGDFVTALYNPASGRRRQPLNQALALFRAARPPATPVIVARQLGRAGEQVEITSLAVLESARIDMTTLVLIGSSATRMAPQGQRRWAYTPRGYGKKLGP